MRATERKDSEVTVAESMGRRYGENEGAESDGGWNNEEERNGGKKSEYENWGTEKSEIRYTSGNLVARRIVLASHLLWGGEGVLSATSIRSWRRDSPERETD